MEAKALPKQIDNVLKSLIDIKRGIIDLMMGLEQIEMNAFINLESLAVGSTVLACRLGISDFANTGSETTDWAGISRKSVKWIL